VIGVLPVFTGVLHERLICDEEAAVAVNPVGDDGTAVLELGAWVLSPE